MKKFLLLITTLCLFAVATAAPSITVNVTRYDKTTLSDTTVYKLNPKQIQYVKNGASTRVIGYRDKKNSVHVIQITVVDKFDSLVNRSNKFEPNLVGVLVVTDVSASITRDTAIRYAYPIDAFVEFRDYTNGSFPMANSQAYIDQVTNAGDATKLVEDANELQARMDSTYAAARDVSGYRYDTANITLKIYDKHIVFNSTTADTITLLNPNLFAGKNPIVIANIGSAVTTLVGGFTVKDKSGSTVSTVGANTVMQLKAYYNGSSYIWLKEY